MPFHGLYVGNINKFPKRFIQEALNEESYDVRDQEVEPNGSANYVILWFPTKAYFNGARAAFIEWQPIGNHVRLKVYPANKPPPAGLIAREVPKIDAKVKKIQKNLTDLVLAWDHDHNLPNKVFAEPAWKAAQKAKTEKERIAWEAENDLEVDEAFRVAAEQEEAQTKTELDRQLGVEPQA